jgi:hypothetical protein
VEGVRVNDPSVGEPKQIQTPRAWEKEKNRMKIDEMTTTQVRASTGIAKWLPIAALAAGLCGAILTASANDRVIVPPGQWPYGPDPANWPAGIGPGYPIYAQFGRDPVNGALVILHDEDWAVIPFYRDPACVPADFNLVELVDVPRCWDCPLRVAAFEIWPVGFLAAPQPIVVRSWGPAGGYDFVALYIVRFKELLDATDDGVLTIGELQALSSAKLGRATFFEEVNGLGFLTEDGQYTSSRYELRASGTLAEDASKTFSVHITAGGRVGKSAKASPDLVQAEVSFGK